MKKIGAIISMIVMLTTGLVACDNLESDISTTPMSTPKATPIVTKAPEKITEKTDYVTERWVAVEIDFTATSTVRNFKEAELDVIFTNRETGTRLTMPGFWDGGKSWKVRFAPTEYGIWDYETKTSGSTDIGINGIKGTIASNAYTGELEIYKHGFVKTQENTKYFVYADGTPFFYLGDTHWYMPAEEFDSAGDEAGDIKTGSHFKYIVDRRAAQGFTVYQSQPRGVTLYDIKNGVISSDDIKGFQELDRYYKYIAEKGLVHANAALGAQQLAENEGYRNNIESLTRYWVARYGAYPVLWTLGQEVDSGVIAGTTLDGKYYEEGVNPNAIALNTFLRMCEEFDETDPYNSPISAHQLNARDVTATGNVPVSNADYGSTNRIYVVDKTRNMKSKASAFLSAEGHTWWANQWRPTYDEQYNFGIAKDYWENGGNKPIVDFEARYHIFAASDFGARAQAWIAYLCGMGHAYGGSGMWAYKSTYGMGEEAYDGIETVSEQKRAETTWADLIDAPISSELRYIRAFMEAIGWWNLTPDFDCGNAFKANPNTTGFYVCSYTNDEVYAVYLYARNTDGTGKLVNLDKSATYTAQWYDTRTGRYTLIDKNIKAANGEYNIPQKPVADDMVLLVTKN